MEDIEHDMRGEAFYEVQDYRAALRDWELLSVHGNKTLSMMADSYTQTRIYTKAESLLNEIIPSGEMPDTPRKQGEQTEFWRMNNLLNRAKIYAMSCRNPQAINDLNMAINMITGNTPKNLICDLYELRGTVFRRIFEFQKASIDLETAIELRA